MLWCDRQPVRSPGFCGSSLTSGTGIRQVCPALAILSSEALWPRCKGGGLSAESLKAIQPERSWLAFIITTDR